MCDRIRIVVSVLLSVRPSARSSACRLICRYSHWSPGFRCRATRPPNQHSQATMWWRTDELQTQPRHLSKTNQVMRDGDKRWGFNALLLFTSQPASQTVFPDFLTHNLFESKDAEDVFWNDACVEYCHLIKRFGPSGLNSSLCVNLTWHQCRAGTTWHGISTWCCQSGETRAARSAVTPWT